MKRPKDYFYRMYALLLVVMLGLLLLYHLPSNILGWEPKPIDMLADLRVEKLEELMDSTGLVSDEQQVISPTLSIDSLEDEEAVRLQEERQRRDQAYERIQSETWAEEDSISTNIIDYSQARTGLRRFFSRLAKCQGSNESVRIAVLGDSFVEGDIFTDALRSNLQTRYGGSGVGWMPMSSNTAGFRMSVHHDFRGWKDLSMLHSRRERHIISGHIFRPEGSAWSRYSLPKGQTAFDRATVYYQATAPLSVKMITDSGEEELQLPATNQGESMSKYTYGTSPTTSIKVALTSGANAMTSYGIALEQSRGVTVDNMSIRGNSGLLLSSLDTDLNQAFGRLRPYDLIILQYGLNVANAKQRDYRGYTKQMKRAIQHLRQLYPESDVMLLGVSDRAQRSSGSMTTMPAIIELHKQQEVLAAELGLPFWSLLKAMRSIGGISQMAAQGKAAKDYTHLNHKGGRELANKFIEAIELEKRYYEEIQ
ncbi:MAG: hypothetical protein Q4A64_05290 [Porphyromonadaceae bacterium]|nr:hypothetical protein [Porphyromonadaceae bacterium]